MQVSIWWRFKKSVRRSVLHKPVQWCMWPLIKFRKIYPQYKWANVFVVSFPKSGRTWFRVFLSSYFHELFGGQYSLDFAPIVKLQADVPRIMFDHGGHYGSDLSFLNMRIDRLYRKRIVLLVRDPRDVVISYFYEITKRDGKFLSWEGDDISNFIRDKEFGIERIIAYMNSWIGHEKDFEALHVLTYESLKEDPKKYFGEVLQFMNMPIISEDAIVRAVEFSSFENMRKLEEEDFYADPRLRPSKKDDETSFKTRKGKVGGFSEVLSREDLAYVNEEMKKLDLRFGYSIVED